MNRALLTMTSTVHLERYEIDSWPSSHTQVKNHYVQCHVPVGVVLSILPLNTGAEDICSPE